MPNVVIGIWWLEEQYSISRDYFGTTLVSAGKSSDAS